MPLQRERTLRRALATYTATHHARRIAAENAWWTRHDLLNDADANVWRCRGCGGWRWGARDCAVCPHIVEVAA